MTNTSQEQLTQSPISESPGFEKSLRRREPKWEVRLDLSFRGGSSLDANQASRLHYPISPLAHALLHHLVSTLFPASSPPYCKTHIAITSSYCNIHIRHGIISNRCNNGRYKAETLLARSQHAHCARSRAKTWRQTPDAACIR